MWHQVKSVENAVGNHSSCVEARNHFVVGNRNRMVDEVCWELEEAHVQVIMMSAAVTGMVLSEPILYPKVRRQSVF